MDHIRRTDLDSDLDTSGLEPLEDQSAFFAVGNNAASVAESHLIKPLAARRGIERGIEIARGAPGGAQTASELVARRAIDIALAAGLIVLLAPLLLALLIATAVACGGSPIFAHERVGKGGVRFRCYKFRTMCLDADRKLQQLLASNVAARREWEGTFKLQRDPRITPLGRLLRSTSLDELPQLFNVLAGSMAMVGPRPIVQSELSRYGRHKDIYLSVTPGLTGLWQVSGRSDTSYRRRVAIDRVYVRTRSIKLDLWIMLATIPAVLSNKGAI